METLFRTFFRELKHKGGFITLGLRQLFAARPAQPPAGSARRWPRPKAAPSGPELRPVGRVEQRGEPRISHPFRTTLRNIDVGGEAFKISAALDNLGAGGMYLRLPRHVKPGTKLLAFIEVPAALAGYVAPWQLVAMLCVVLRAEPQPDGWWGVAVAFKRPILEQAAA